MIVCIAALGLLGTLPEDCPRPEQRAYKVCAAGGARMHATSAWRCALPWGLYRPYTVWEYRRSRRPEDTLPTLVTCPSLAVAALNSSHKDAPALTRRAYEPLVPNQTIQTINNPQPLRALILIRTQSCVPLPLTAPLPPAPPASPKFFHHLLGFVLLFTVHSHGRRSSGC